MDEWWGDQPSERPADRVDGGGSSRKKKGKAKRRGTQAQAEEPAAEGATVRPADTLPWFRPRPVAGVPPPPPPLGAGMAAVGSARPCVVADARVPGGTQPAVHAPGEARAPLDGTFAEARPHGRKRSPQQMRAEEDGEMDVREHDPEHPTPAGHASTAPAAVVFWLLSCIVLVVLAFLTTKIAACAKGSGLPEVKSLLSGQKSPVPDYANSIKISCPFPPLDLYYCSIKNVGLLVPI